MRFRLRFKKWLAVVRLAHLQSELARKIVLSFECLTPKFSQKLSGKSQRVKCKGQKLLKTLRIKVRRRYFIRFFQKIERITFTGCWIFSKSSRKIVFFSEKFSEVFTLWVFALKPYPGFRPLFCGSEKIACEVLARFRTCPC